MKEILITVMAVLVLGMIQGAVAYEKGKVNLTCQKLNGDEVRIKGDWIIQVKDGFLLASGSVIKLKLKSCKG
jgi:hypothetical protein